MLGWTNAVKPTKPPGQTPTSRAMTREVAPEGFLLPHFRTFTAIINTFSRLYSHRYDEVIRKSRQDALGLKRDVYLRALLQERILPLGGWAWEIEADPDDVAEDQSNPKDPRSEDREKLRRSLQSVVKRTPRLSRMRRSLGWGVWYGRQGVQWVPGRTTIGGEDRTFVRDYRPIMGDKIVFDFDGVPGVMLQAGAAPAGATVRYTDTALPVLLLDRPEYRERVIIHTHDLDDADITEPIMAGRIHGVGLRDMIAWGAELRLELMAWVFDFMEKVGNLGLLVVYYDESNPLSKEKAQITAKNAGRQSAIAVPRPKGSDKQAAGIELIPANMTGVQFLTTAITEWFERHIERAIVGQSMSGGKDAGDGLGGTGRADFAKDTKFQLLRSDAEDQAETLTEDLLPPLVRANWPDCPYRFAWQYRVPDPAAGDRLDAITKVASLPGKKMVFLASEIRELTGTTKPNEGDETVGGDDVPPPDNPQAGSEDDDLFAPGEFEQMIGEAGNQGSGSVPFLSSRVSVPYAMGGQWNSHQLKSGPRKGRMVYENATTGELRDTPPEQRQPGQEDQTAPRQTSGDDEQAYRGHIAAIKAAGPQAVQAAKTACVKVWETLGLWSTKLALAGLTYEDALPDAKELSNPLTGSTSATGGVDLIAGATGIPGAQYLAAKIVPAVIGFAVGRVKRYLASKKTGQQPGEQARYQRTLAQYAASDWQPHQLKTGPRKGQTVYENRTTGELRDEMPATQGTDSDPAGHNKDAAPDKVSDQAKAAILQAIRESVGMSSNEGEQAGDEVADTHGHERARGKLESQIVRGHEQADSQIERVREKEDKARERVREKRNKEHDRARAKEEAAIEKKYDKQLDTALEEFDDERDRDREENLADWRSEGTPEESDEEEDIRDKLKEWETEMDDKREAIESEWTEKKEAELKEIGDRYDELEAGHDQADDTEDEEAQATRDAEDEERTQSQQSETDAQLADFDTESLGDKKPSAEKPPVEPEA